MKENVTINTYPLLCISHIVRKINEIKNDNGKWPGDEQIGCQVKSYRQ